MNIICNKGIIHIGHFFDGELCEHHTLIHSPNGFYKIINGTEITRDKWKPFGKYGSCYVSGRKIKAIDIQDKIIKSLIKTLGGIRK